MTAAEADGRKLEAFRASDYFEALHAYAVRLIERGKAYVCDHTPEEVDRMRGAPGAAGAGEPRIAAARRPRAWTSSAA